MNAFWVTFYSYKGGVGRTMALANVAAMLAKNGRRVLLIDFDLEAPGLDSFEGLGCTRDHDGVVEYVTEYLESGKAPEIGRFIQECKPASMHLRGKMWLMPSGKKDARYNRERARINWSDLYDKHDGERFIENWKAAIAKIYQPDYVFIDSRTGLTDVGGICTLHLPQMVVLLYALNDQNIHGIAGVARAISSAKNTRPPQLLTVATPVPAMLKESTGLLQQRFLLAEKELGVKPHCQIHYDPRVSLKEEIVVWDEQRGNPSENRLPWEYNQLRQKITEYDVSGLDFLLKESERAVEEMDEERAGQASDDLIREYGDRAESYYQIAQACRAFGRLSEVENNLRRALEIDPFFSGAFSELIGFLRVKKRHKEAIEVCQQRLLGLQEDPQGDANNETLEHLGEICMASGDYQTAADAYGQLPRKSTPGNNIDDSKLLIHRFNYAEARRRAGVLPADDELKEIIRLYERGAVTEGAGSIISRLNHVQAMHIPFALLGETTRAIKMLETAHRLASSVTPRDRVFCVATYTNLPLPEWLQENRQMIEALDAGTLWDGTKLPEPA
jgi:tetratricopeptide (TPR) repeat protein